MSADEVHLPRHADVKKRYSWRMAAALLAATTVTAGAGTAIATSASATAWKGGVHYSHVFHKWSTAWDFFIAGQPTSAGYSQMIKDCRRMGGNSITKAGTGTIRGSGSGYTTVTFDYSCLH